jgi:hypothetical protein
VALAVMLTAIAANIGAFAATSAWWPSLAFLGGWTATYTFSVNAYNAASFGAYMALSNPRIGATHFAIYMATTNLTYSWSAPLGGMVADRWGYVSLFALAALIQLAVVPMVIPLDPRVAAARWRSREAA